MIQTVLKLNCARPFKAGNEHPLSIPQSREDA